MVQQIRSVDLVYTQEAQAHVLHSFYNGLKAWGCESHDSVYPLIIIMSHSITVRKEKESVSLWWIVFIPKFGNVSWLISVSSGTDTHTKEEEGKRKRSLITDLLHMRIYSYKVTTDRVNAFLNYLHNLVSSVHVNILNMSLFLLQVNMKMREITEREHKVKHHPLESPSHQKVKPFTVSSNCFFYRREQDPTT